MTGERLLLRLSARPRWQSRWGLTRSPPSPRLSTRTSTRARRWTVNGKVNRLDLRVVYTGSYMVRHIEGQQDYSNYLRSTVGSYYGVRRTRRRLFQLKNFRSLTGKPLSATRRWATGTTPWTNQHQSHEFRVSTTEDIPHPRPARRLLGEVQHRRPDELQLPGHSAVRCGEPGDSANAGGRTACRRSDQYPARLRLTRACVTNANTAFGEDVQRGYKQTAVFASVDFDIIPKVLTSPAGRATTTTMSSRRVRSSTARAPAQA